MEALESLALRGERRRIYSGRIAEAIHRWVEGSISFAEMTRLCDGAAQWYWDATTYRDRVYADPVTYGYRPEPVVKVRKNVGR